MEKKRSSVKRSKKVAAETKRGPTLKDLLALRSRISRARPHFLREESWRYDRVNETWRRPKGIDSHMRLEVKGWPKVVKVGYRGPVAVRGLHPSGLKDILVHSLGELERLNPATDAARISSTVGGRRSAQLYLRAKELGIRILNPRRLPPKES